MNHKVCEYMLGIDPKWLSLNKTNSEIMIKLIEETNIQRFNWKLDKNLNLYINNEKAFFDELSNEEIFDIEKYFGNSINCL